MTSRIPVLAPKPKVEAQVVLREPCADLDDDCKFVEDKLYCQQYDPDMGYCPFLAANKQPRH